MLRAPALLVAAFAVTLARAAPAAPTSRLVYSRTADAAACPDEQALRRAVAARVGYDPFFPYAARTIVASLARRDHSFVATVDLIDESGVSHGVRALHGERECTELLDAVALAIAIAIDPKSLSRPAAPAVGPSPPVATPLPEVVPLPSSAAVEATPPLTIPEDHRGAVTLEASASAVLSFNVAPRVAVGFAPGIAARWHALSLAVEGRIDAPASTAARGGGEVSSWLLLGALVPCAHLGPLFGCGVVQVGSAQTTGIGVPQSRTESLAWRAVGGRLGLLFPLGEDLHLGFQADVLADLERMTLELNGNPVWQASPVAVSGAAEVVVHFK